MKPNSVWTYNGNGLDVRLIQVDTVQRAIERGAASHGADLALTSWTAGARDRTWTYAELREAVVCVASYLHQRFELNRGDRVVVISKNCPQAYFIYLGIMYAGGVVVPVGPGESIRAVRHIVANCEAKLLISTTGNNFAELGIATLEMSQVANESATVGALNSAVALPTVCPDDLAVILFTSGTTSLPKGVCLSHYNVMVNAEGLLRAHQLNVNRNHLCVLPLHHANAFGFSILASVYAACHVTLCDQWTFDLWAAVEQQAINIASLVPEIIRSLGQRPPNRALQSLRYVVSAAAPLPSSVAKAFELRTRIPIRQGYGLSECTNFAATMPADMSEELRKRLLSDWVVPSIGPELFGTHVSIRDSVGLECAEGAEGEICIRGHNIMSGYLNAPTETADAFAGGWFHSGDRGFYTLFDGTRYFFVTGRQKELLIRYGECISPRAVEAELSELGALGRYAVCGFQNDIAGEEIGVYVQVENAPANIEQRLCDIVAQCPLMYRPRAVLWGKAPLAATVTGKVKRKVISERFDRFSRTMFGNAAHILEYTESKHSQE